MLKFRRARLDSALDRERLLRLQYQLFPSDVIKDFYEGTEAPEWWLVLHDDEAVAFASMGYEKEGESILSRCGVVEEFRGRGIQRRLIRARIKRAITRGVKAITTYTARWNKHSSENLASLGFVKVRTKGGFHDWRLELP